MERQLAHYYWSKMSCHKDVDFSACSQFEQGNIMGVCSSTGKSAWNDSAEVDFCENAAVGRSTLMNTMTSALVLSKLHLEWEIVKVYSPPPPPVVDEDNNLCPRRKVL